MVNSLQICFKFAFKFKLRRYTEAGFIAMSELHFAAAAAHFAASCELQPAELFAYFPRLVPPPAGSVLPPRRRCYWAGA